MRVEVVDPGHPPNWVPYGTSRFGDELVIPDRFTVRLLDGDVPNVEVLQLTVTVHDSGVRCEQISFIASPDQEGVTTASLRDVPMDKLLIELCVFMAHVPTESPEWVLEPREFLVPVSAGDPDHIEAARDAFRRGGRRRITTDELAEAARIYRANIEAGDPTKKVAEALHLSHSTAARRVKRARDAGLLGKTTKGRVGEEPA